MIRTFVAEHARTIRQSSRCLFQQDTRQAVQLVVLHELEGANPMPVQGSQGHA